ncbi:MULTISPECIES: hypothetical protein [unclassified Caballeronia]|uniref:hypothetical protein n=1 Tax=unclassified Caballeronia TaxID=2646786 RepID=UPI0028646CFA|nr:MULTISPECIES: hypothetical protein [unclassified Caballeronia]MDR5771490.1 hypothetical protein [Caballeronia sp. LZ002]MDR5805251.1 hypothetical protein [Caballeronia sp. LZ001]MDR5846926.1 hypothetical protein [Caballeronia sp. LZ003]
MPAIALALAGSVEMPIYSLIKQASKNAKYVLDKYPYGGPNPDALNELINAVEPLRQMSNGAWDAAESLLCEAEYFYSGYCAEVRHQTYRSWASRRSRDDMYRDVIRMRLEAIKYLSIL